MKSFKMSIYISMRKGKFRSKKTVPNLVNFL